MKNYLLVSLFLSLLNFSTSAKVESLTDFVISTNVKKIGTSFSDSFGVNVSNLFIFGGKNSDTVSLGAIRKNIGNFVEASTEDKAGKNIVIFMKDIVYKKQAVRVAFLMNSKPLGFLSACFSIPKLGKGVTCKAAPGDNLISFTDSFAEEIQLEILEDDRTLSSRLKKFMDDGKRIAQNLINLTKI